MIKTCENCQAEFECFPTINGKKRNLKNRRFCFECSPFGSHNTRSLRSRKTQSKHSTTGLKQCCKCQQELPITEFYKNNGNTCKKCNIKGTIERQRKFKQLCVEYKGGHCEKCGYDKCYGSLQFHHLDPSIKTENINRWRLTSIELNFDEVKLELDKCILLCANCHGEAHWGNGGAMGGN